MSDHSNRFLKFGAAPPDRRGFSGGSNALFIKRADEDVPLLRLLTEKRGRAESKDLFAKSLPSQPCNRASARPSPSRVCAAHTEFVAALAGAPPRTIPLDADAIDLEDRADHLDKVFGALSVYVAVIIDDTTQNAPGRLELPDVEGILSDLASDVIGTIEHAAEDMEVRIA